MSSKVDDMCHALFQLKTAHNMFYYSRVVFKIVECERKHDPWIEGTDQISGKVVIFIYPDGSWGYTDLDRKFKKTGSHPLFVNEDIMKGYTE